MRTVVGIMALIAAIFIAESFTTLMRIVIDNGGSLPRLALLLLLKLPEIIDFALPLALMLGIYFAIVGARDDNELIVCATAGSKWSDIPFFAARVGIAGFFLSLLFVGVLTPMATYLMRAQQYQMEVKGVIKQVSATGPHSFIRTIEGQSVIATPPTNPEAKRGNLYIFQENADRSWRFRQADDWNVIKPEADEGLKVRLKGFREYSGSPAKDAATETSPDGQTGVSMGSVNIRASSVVLDIQIEKLLPTYDSLRRRNESLFFGIIGINAALFTPNRKFAEALARALLCPIAALFAVAGAAWSGTQSGRFAALPVTVVASLAYDVIARAMMGDSADTGALALWTTTAVLSAAALFLPVAYILSRGELIVLPGRNRA